MELVSWMRSIMNKQIIDNRRSLDSLLFVEANQVVNNQAFNAEQGDGRVFVPITDDIIFDHPEQIKGPLIPYFAGMECQNWLSIELNPDEEMEPLTDNTQGAEPLSTEHCRMVPKPSLELVAS